jgi:3-oxoacyl-[acyl-carrier protein] reductase
MIIVTGASSGLGEAIAERLSQKKIEVLGIARTGQNANFQIVHADVRSKNDLKEIANSLLQEKKQVSCLINAAGTAAMNLAIMTSEEKVNSIIDVNLKGTIFASQVFAPNLIRNGSGTILNFSSIATAINLEGESIYAASKAGIENFSRTLAKELSGFNIRVNCIAPGPILTNLIKNVDSEMIANVINQQIIKRMITKKELCDLVETLLDEKFSTITGQILSPGGVR